MIFNIRSWADVRALLYVILPIGATIAVSYGFLTNDTAQLWTALIFAVLGPVLAAFHARTVSAIRTGFYALFGALQAILVAYHLITNETLTPWMPLIVAIIGAATGGVAVANTNTTGPVNPTENHPHTRKTA